MITDDERREVARRLREYASWDDEEECLVDCTDWGERVLNLLGCGDTEGECYAALADLIEPDTTTDTTKTPTDTTKCDRDALLALADEMQGELDECADDHEIVGKLQYRVDRIREALGKGES